MNTYWQVMVQTYDGDKRGTSCECGKPELESALAEGIELASFYRLSAGHESVTIELTECCNRCFNSGTVIHRGIRSSKRVRCPLCKGKIPSGHIGPIPFRLHDNVTADLQLTH
jgi:hypothetical protein